MINFLLQTILKTYKINVQLFLKISSLSACVYSNDLTTLVNLQTCFDEPWLQL